MCQEKGGKVMRIYYCQDNQKIRFYDKELQKLDIF